MALFPTGKMEVSNRAQFSLAIGIDETPTNDLFTILANRDQRLPTIIVSQSGPRHWARAWRRRSLPIQS